MKKKPYKKRSTKEFGHSKKDNAEDEKMRLNKYIAHAGICSRREADKLIEEGLISINGKRVTELGVKVAPEDEVRYKGKPIKPEKPVYILMNKPKDTITTVKDPRQRKTVIDIIRPRVRQKVFPVGRLDRNTTGVLLLTNDGKLAEKLMHPSHKKKKVYHVFLNKDLSKKDAEKLVSGIELEDGFMQFDAVGFPKDEIRNEIGIEIHSGRNRVVRRMFEATGYEVVKLDRVFFAGLSKKGLSRGRWRYLTDKEVGILKKGAYL